MAIDPKVMGESFKLKHLELLFRSDYAEEEMKVVQDEIHKTK